MLIRSDSFASLSALILAAALAAGCLVRDPNYCPGANPNNNCLDPKVGPRPCTASSDCSAMAPVCDRDDTMTCVQCTTADASACTGKTPVCGGDHACRACTAHDECDSRECLPDGACANDTDVAYVAPFGIDNLACTKAMPCKSVSWALAINRPYVKLVGKIDEGVTVAGGRVVTFVGEPGTTLTRASGGPILTVRDSNTSLAIYDLTISDAPINHPGILLPPDAGSPSVMLTRVELRNNSGGGISAAAPGGALTVTQSKFRENPRGGIVVSDGTFTIVGNMFYGNGAPTSSTGGVSIKTAEGQGSNRLELNSFHINVTAAGHGSAIHCSSGLLAARNNIMSHTMPVQHVAGPCTHSYSIVWGAALLPGPGNVNADPLFVNPAAGDLHVRSGSPALGRADPSSNLTGLAARDLDGDVRTSPADIGADEVP
jgi:hypothetical protein